MVGDALNASRTPLGRFSLLPPTITITAQILDLGFEQFDQLAGAGQFDLGGSIAEASTVCLTGGCEPRKTKGRATAKVEIRGFLNNS